MNLSPYATKLFPILLCGAVLSVSNPTSAQIEGPLGKIRVTANARATYDSNIFSMPSGQFEARKATTPSLKSQDDLILELTPAAHFTKKIKLIVLQGTIGARGAYYVSNTDKSLVNPITSLSMDFDDSLTKRVSNNAKIRFDGVFDLGQKTETSVLENDLTSYTYYSLGLNVRYNHSPKFGLGSGVNYTYRDYQNFSGINQYQDVASMPISARAFYIYSPKLDFFTEYTHSSTEGGSGASSRAIDATTHTYNFGVQGDLFTKASGSFRIGHVSKNYDLDTLSEDSISLKSELAWQLSQKTGIGFNLGKTFEPSPQNNSILSTTAGVTVNHRLNEKLTGTLNLNWSSSDYTTIDGLSGTLKSGTRSMDMISFGGTLRKKLTQRFDAGGGYTFSSSSQSVGGDFNRHVLFFDVNGQY